MNHILSNENEGNLIARYQILAQRREYQDRLFWSRVQTLHWIQVGVIGGSLYFAKWQWNDFPIYSVFTMFIGLILTGLIFIICYYDWKDTEANKETMENLGETLGIRWGSDRRFRIFNRIIYGHTILYTIFMLFLLVDFLLILFFIFY